MRRILATYKAKTCVLATLLICFWSFGLSAASVEPKDNAKTYIHLSLLSNHTHSLLLSYPHPIRLEAALRDSLENLDKIKSKTTLNSKDNSIFWIGSSLFEKTEAPDKNDIIATLVSIEAFFQHNQQYKDADAIKQLTHWISTHIHYKRVFIPLDYDTVRINKSHNPLLNGKYSLILPARPEHVTVLGATTAPKQLSWHKRWSAKDYLNITELLHNAEDSFVWVIQPDGKTKTHPIAYWNETHLDIAPGAIIYVGYKTLPVKHSDQLNQDIIKLLKNKAL